jgi:hypothetical protein
LGQFAGLPLHVYEVSDYGWDARGWLWRSLLTQDPDLAFSDELIWPLGVNNFRVTYTAGYPAIPPAVEEACATWTAERFYRTQRDPEADLLRTEHVSTAWSKLDSEAPSANVRALLAPYRRRVF